MSMKKIFLTVFLFFSFQVQAEKIDYRDLTLSKLMKLAKEQDVVAQYILAEAYYEGRSVDKNIEMALKWYKKACVINKSVAAIGACGNAAVLLIGKKGNKNIHDKVMYAKRACEGGDLNSCGLLGSIYELGDSNVITKNYKKSEKYYKKACSKKMGKACFALGSLCYNKKICSASAKNYYDKSCVLGYGKGCQALGESIAETTGNKVSSSTFSAYKKGCIANFPESCALIASMYTLGGEGIPKNKIKALKYFNKACNLGHTSSCTTAILLQASKN